MNNAHLFGFCRVKPVNIHCDMRPVVAAVYCNSQSNPTA